MTQRERFEVWAKRKNYPLSESKILGVGVTYKYATTEAAWQAWQAAYPEGWKAVPEEADDNMIRAFWGSCHQGESEVEAAKELWRDALAAAPKPEDVCK